MGEIHADAPSARELERARVAPCPTGDIEHSPSRLEGDGSTDEIHRPVRLSVVAMGIEAEVVLAEPFFEPFHVSELGARSRELRAKRSQVRYSSRATYSSQLLAPSSLMVRLSPQNRERPIELLAHNYPRQLVRKGERAEAPTGHCRADQVSVQPVRPSDHECERACQQQPALQLLGEICTGPAGTDPRQCNHVGSLGDPSDESFGFLSPLSRGSRCSAGLSHFVLVKGDVSLEPMGIVVEGLTVVWP